MNEKDKNKSPLTMALESILTIDGQGRPAKARQLLEILQRSDSERIDPGLLETITEIGNRKFF